MIIFSIREGLRNFRHLGIMGVLTIIALTLTLAVSGLSLRGYFVLDKWRHGLLGRFEIEAFLESSIDSTKASDLAKQIAAIRDIGSVIYISKAAAAARFNEQFGEDIYELLDYNPLPSSLIVTLNESADPAQSWEITARSIKILDGIEDVIYQGNLLFEVNQFYAKAGRISFAAVLIMLIISLVFTTLTVHGVIRSREEFIRVVAFSGGTRGMAHGPFVALGGIYGVVSAIAAIALVEALLWLIRLGWSIEFTAPWWWYPGMILAGVLLATIGAGWAASRKIREI